MERDARGDELLEDLAIQLESQLLKEGLEPESAAEKAVSIARKMREHWGGQSLYFPKGLVSKMKARNDSIWREFNGTNLAELARTHGVTEMRIRQIIEIKRQSNRPSAAVMPFRQPSDRVF